MWGYILPLALALPCANAITLHRRDDPAVLSLPVTRSDRSHALQKRSSKTASTSLYNEQNMYYMVNITLGTPPQNLSLSLDTGSSDIWVNVPNSTYCAADGDVCSSTGLFDLSDSSTFTLLDYYMNATYVSGSLATGPYATDTLTIGGATVKDMQFALAETSSNPHGILGIAYPAGEFAATQDNKQYSNLPEALVSSGAINSAAFSLWLNKFDGTGNLLFGGVNTARYQGELQTVPMLKVDNEYMTVTIALTDVSLTSSGKTKSYSKGLPLAVTLDNGSAFITLPEDLLEPIFKKLGAGYNATSGFSYIPCSMSTSDTNVTFSFSGAEVNIPVSELVFDNYVEAGFPEGDCIFGMVYGEPGVSLMGDPFLRGAYVVYDLANNEISLADTNYDGGDDDIVEIGTGTAAVPGATLMPNPVTSATGAGSVATATSKGLAVAALPTANSNNLLPGLLGAGLLLAL